MAHYRITRRGAQHRRKEGEGKNRVFVVYGYGAVISLTDDQIKSGKFRHLGLERTNDATRSSAEAPPPSAPAAPIVESEKPADDPKEDEGGKKEDEGGGAADDLTDEQRAELKSLREEVVAVNSGPTLTAARNKVVASGILGEADAVPTKKKDLLEAIETKLGTEE